MTPPVPLPQAVCAAAGPPVRMMSGHRIQDWPAGLPGGQR